MNAQDMKEWMPLMQAMAGSLGAFAVAAFTVWVTNRHSLQREEKQAARLRATEREKVLREKLEALVRDAEAAYRYASRSAIRVLEVEESVPYGLKPRMPTETAEVLGAALNRAQLMSDLYLPTLGTHLRALSKHTYEALEFSIRSAAEASEAWEAWRDGPGTTFEARFMDAIRPATQAHTELVSEARRLIESGFDLPR